MRKRKMTDMKKWSLIVIVCCILIGINVLGDAIAVYFKLPVWLDTFGTMVAGYTFGPVAGGIVGLFSHLLICIKDESATYIYAFSNMLMGLIIAEERKKGHLEDWFDFCKVTIILITVSIAISVPDTLFLKNGIIGNSWANDVAKTMQEMLRIPRGLSIVLGEFYIDFADKSILMFLLFEVVQCYHWIRNKKRINISKMEVLNACILPIVILETIMKKRFPDDFVDSTFFMNYIIIINTMILCCGTWFFLMVRERKKMEESSSVKRDSLTGLFNMHHFLAESDKVLQDFKDIKIYEYAFVYCNIRNFKFFNMKHDMEEGDQVLKKFADHIREIAGQNISARFEQDHFVILTQSYRANEIVKKLNDSFEQDFRNTGMNLKAGIYYVTDQVKKASTACQYAKLACNSIKHSSEYCCEYNEELGRKLAISSYVIQNLDRAISNHYIKVYYQPVVRAINGKTCGMEALARWIDPEKGFLSPGDFIPALEENHEITKLDLYMLRQICKEMRDRQKQGKLTVPISFNLSRVDFEECDIFREVERIVLEYGIARDMLNIEITESTIMNDPEKFKRKIMRFRDGGYQVWMDDFGSGYSSLNVLKEFQFDEIKLDMKFIQVFDAKSKEIITAVISMAKQIGIQTLAEGVETQEQFDFLRYIGCEKVQGYFFSKPLPTDELLKLSLCEPANMEKRAWKNYYNQMGACNFVTDKSLAIVEYDGKTIFHRYMNKKYEEILNGSGTVNMELMHDIVNSPTSSVYEQFRSLREICHVGNGVHQMVYSVHGHYIQLNAKCIAEQENYGAFELEIVEMTNSQSNQETEYLDKAYRGISALFDTVCVVNFETDEFKIIKQGQKDKEYREALYQAKSVWEAEQAILQTIHREDQKAFMEFLNSDKIKECIIDGKESYITHFFRSRRENGAYVWKAHTLLYMGGQRILYCSHFEPITERELLRKVYQEYGTESENAIPLDYQKYIYKGILESKTMNIFWKDTNRRFLGANDKFLRTFRFHDVSEIIGKTDEDMQWHLGNKAFADDEIRVLEQGEVVINRPGICIIQGVGHNIVASKEPLYDENGTIIGLIGYFVSADELNENVKLLGTVGIKDPITGLMSPHGLTNILAAYVEDWELNHQNFVAIHIAVNEYFRSVQTYGEKIAGTILRDIGQIISRVIGNKGICAREYAGNFMVLVRYQEKAEAENLIKELRENLENVHILASHSVTLHPKIQIIYSENMKSILSLIGSNIASSLWDIAERGTQNTKLKYLLEK